MFTAYREALVSYVRSRIFIGMMLTVALFAVCWGLVTGARAPQGAAGQDNWLLWTTAGFLIGGIIAAQVAGRLSSDWKNLVPRYREIHLAAFATLLLVAVAALVGWAQWRDGPSARIAAIVVLAAAAGCHVARVSWLGMIAVPLFCASILLPMGSRPLEKSWALAGGPLVSLALFAAAGVLLVWFIAWLWNLTAEQAVFVPPLGRAGFKGLFQGAPLSEQQREILRSQVGLFGRLNELANRFGDARLDAALRRRSARPGWKLRRWTLSWSQFPVVLPYVLLAPLLALMFNFLPPHSPPPSERGALPGGPFNALFPVIMGVICAYLTTLQRRWPFLGTEILRPVTRRRFFQELSVGLATQWFVAAPLTFALIALFCPSRRWLFHVDGGSSLDLIAMFAATLLAIFALLIWAARFDSLWSFSLAAGAAVPFVMPAWDLWDFTAGTWGPLVIAAAVALGGAAVLWDAYRRWLVVDLG